MFQLTRSVTWQALERLRDKTANDRIRDYFTSDPQRFEKLATFPERLAVGELGKYEAT